MRQHVGAHILCGDTDESRLTCGLCGSPCSVELNTCRCTVKKGATNAVFLESNCAFTPKTKMSIAAASKFSADTPCTNVPMICMQPSCGIWLWKYDYLNHLSMAHPEYVITEAEVAQYAVSSVEFHAVLNKSKFWFGSVKPEARIGQLSVPQRSMFWSLIAPDSIGIAADVEMGAAPRADLTAAGQSRPREVSASGAIVEKRPRVLDSGD